MNDRELLELAAKAADILALPFYGHTDGKLYLSNGCEWNPLTDDGEALRLAVKLGMRLELDSDWNRSHAQQIPKGEWHTCPHNDDPDAATRRAIVRAAAEIGRAMP